MNKKIVFFANYNSNDYKGGIVNILESYCDNASIFKRLGYDVAWFNPHIVYSKNRILSFFQKIFNLQREKKSVLKTIKENNPQILHIHSSRNYTLYKDLIISKFIKKKTKTTIVLSIHFADIDKILSSNNKIKKNEIKMLNSYVDNVICLSSQTSDDFKKILGADKVSLLYTFHCFDNYILKPTMLASSKLELLFMGSIDKRKGVFDLIDSIRDNDNIHLSICGGFGNDLDANNRFKGIIASNKNIDYCGYLSGEEKEIAFEKADVFVLPSYGEGLPIVLLEAMAKGCAIISTNVGAIPEIVSSENGFVINPGSINELKNSINKLYEDRSLLFSMKKKNVEKGRDYSIESNITQLTSIYTGILNNGQQK